MDKSDADAPLSRRRFIKSSVVLAATAIVAPYVLRIKSAFAAYPDRTLRIVVANTPGGPSDIIARIMAAALQEQLGAVGIKLTLQPAAASEWYARVVSGATNLTPTRWTQRADPDGLLYILFHSKGFANTMKYRNE